MAKRRADKELTDRNWDQEDEPEEAGEIEIANEDTLKSRQILKGKRRGAATSQNKEFSGFAGFSFKPTAASTPFSFNTRSVTNGNADKDVKQMEQVKEPNGQTKPPPPSNGGEKKNSSYLGSLKNLNESVLAWIKSHVEKNPFCILTPVFKDYEKHLSDIMKNKDEGQTEKMDEDVKSKVDAKSVAETKTTPSFQFGNTTASATTANEVKTSSAPTFSFGKSATSSTTTNYTESKTIGSGFQFGTSTTNTSAASGFAGFNFKPSTQVQNPASGFSFAVNKPTEGEGAASQEEDEEYVPPKPESTEISEEGSVYSIKCKLFYQKDGAWAERGVGYLHLKPSNDKLQMVVRADTTLGNIILNIIISPSMPLQRQGKNNVSLVCVPNPPVDKKADPNKPIPMLIRVKTTEDADQLLEKMEELRKKD